MQRRNELALIILAYNATVLFSMALVYQLIGFRRHFHVPENTPVNFGTVLYFSLVTHFTVGYGDIYPTTQLSRSMVAVHITLVWLQAAGILFSWHKIKS